MFETRKIRHCGFCKSKVKIYKSKNLNVIEFLSFLTLGILITFLFWDSLAVEGLLIIAFLLLSAELFKHVKYRNSLICKSCGFDPVLYRKDHKLASEKIKIFLARRKELPEFLLQSRPPILLENKKPNKIKRTSILNERTNHH